MLLVGGIGLNLLLIGIELLIHPAVLGGDRSPWVLADVLVLVIYAAVAVYTGRRKGGMSDRAGWIGGLAGAILFGQLAVEYFGNLPAPAARLAFLATMVLVIAIFAGLGSIEADFRSAVLAGAWAAMVAMVVLWPLVWTLNAVFEPRLEVILAGDPDYGRGNTLKELSAYVAWNTLASAFSHALVLPMLGAGGAGLGCLLAGRRRRPAVL